MAAIHRLAAGWASAIRRSALGLLALITCCLVTVLLWRYRPIVSAAAGPACELPSGQSSKHDNDDGWGDDFPGHQPALIAAAIQPSLSYCWYT